MNTGKVLSLVLGFNLSQLSRSEAFTSIYIHSFWSWRGECRETSDLGERLAGKHKARAENEWERGFR